MPVILDTQKAEIRRIEVQSLPRANSSGDAIWKITQKRTDRVTQVIEHLPNKCEALSSNSSSIKKKERKASETPNSPSLPGRRIHLHCFYKCRREAPEQPEP
jgi:hypothetical protein